MILRQISSNAYEWYWPQSPSQELSSLIISYVHELNQWIPSGLNIQLVPGLNSLAIHFGRFPLDERVKWLEEMSQRIESQGDRLQEGQGRGRLWNLICDYQGQDLLMLSQKLHIPVDEIIQIHSQAEYVVALMGFQKGFPYLLGLDHRLKVPRQSSPRVEVPSGSVAIANEMCGIYPNSSPGGWNLIGRIEDYPAEEIAPGDRICFIPQERP